MKIRRRCKCGCGSITNYNKKWVLGHHARIYNPSFLHGLSNHKLYSVWKHIQSRCYNLNDKAYHNYGGRGIRICIRWRKSFISFYRWAIDNSWKEGLEIDREDNDRNYTPDNCRFVTSTQNNLNKRIQTNNTSGYRGVCFDKNRNKYMAYNKVNKVAKYIGRYYTAKYAAKARNNYIIENNLLNRLN